jgi:hypothetical protein
MERLIGWSEVLLPLLNETCGRLGLIRRNRSNRNCNCPEECLHSINRMGSLPETNVSPVRYELGFCIPEGGILHSHRRGNLKSYTALTGWVLYRRRNVSPVRYELGFCIPEGGIFHSHRRGNLKSYKHYQCK